MNEEKQRVRGNLIAITYGVVLFIVLSNFDSVLALLGKLLAIMAPFLYAIAIAFILNILMKVFEGKIFAFLDKKPKLRKIKRPLSLTITFLVVALFFYGLIAFVIPQLSASVAQFTSNIDNYIQSVENFFNKTAASWGLTNDFLAGIQFNWEQIITKSLEFTSATIPLLFSFTKNLTNGLINLVLGIVIALYLLGSKESLILMLKKLIYAFLPRKYAQRILELGTLTNKAFDGFISGQLTEAMIIGVLCFIGMLIFGMPYALLVSVLIAVTSVIPMVGAFLGTIPSAFIILMAEPGKAIWFVLFIVLLQQFESNLIYPRVVGNSIGMSGLWIILVVIVGGSLFGLVGMLVGIPAFAVFYRVVKRSTQRRLEDKNIEIQ